jgi:FkbM family methyltransferase
MKHVISQRLERKNGYKRILDIFIARELAKRSSIFNEKRGMPIAVFGNDWIGINIALKGLFEEEHLKDLNHLLINLDFDVSNSTAIDIGSNIGNHAIEFAKYFKKVICYEPNPRAYDLLATNTKHLKNVEVFNWGIGSKEEFLQLQENINNIGGSSAKYQIDAKNIVNIEIKPLDNFLESFKKVMLLKIDVEGMEIEVLKGAEKIITEFYPLICFEQHKTDFLDCFNETEVIDWLRKKDYKIYAIYKPTRKNIIVRRLKNLMQIIIGFKDSREIIEYKKLPRGDYDMVYAIHSSINTP